MPLVESAKYQKPSLASRPQSGRSTGVAHPCAKFESPESGRARALNTEFNDTDVVKSAMSVEILAMSP